MKVSIWKDNNDNLEMYPCFVQSNKTILEKVEVKSETYEYLLNCEIEIRNKLIQDILNKNLWNK